MTADIEQDFPDRPIFLLIAPTGSGKTDAAIALARNFNLEIINADAYQFFSMMDIGTAKPSKEERAQAPHHLFDICAPDQPYSAHQFARDAKSVAHNIFAKDKHPLLVGGSGFYARAFMTPTSNLPSGTTECDDYHKAYQNITAQDPDLTTLIHPHDHYRIARADFLLQHGYMPSQVWQQQTQQQIKNPCHTLSINIDRDKLYERINQRVVAMIAQGLVQETSSILKAFPASRSRLQKTIGYCQVLQHLDGEITHEQMRDLIQQKTRNYAKRQMTWIRNQLTPKQAHFDYAFEQLSCYIEDTLL